MGNCQDQFRNVDQYETQNGKTDVLIDRSHRRVFATKYETNIGYLINKEQVQNLDSEIMHKSVPLNKFRLAQKPQQRKKKQEVDLPKLQKIDLKFYYSLGLPDYTFTAFDKDYEQMQKMSSNDKDCFIHQAEDRVGVIYVGERNSKGHFHGNGILKANTVHYIGHFFHGTKHFHGRQIYTNQVYEGSFSYDFRKGHGTRYTQEYVDEGLFDKYIQFGKRTFRNGNVYQGTFENNQIHTVCIPGFDNKSCRFYDSETHLLYEDKVQFSNGELIRANTVCRASSFDEKGQPIGKFQNGKIVKQQDLSANQRKGINAARQKDLSEQQKIQRRIREWE